MDKQKILEFKSKLKLNELTIKQFALDHGFNPAVFSMAINGYTNLREEFEQEILAYLYK